MGARALAVGEVAILSATWSRMAPMIVGWVMVATGNRRPPQVGHSSTSSPQNVRRIKVAQSIFGGLLVGQTASMVIVAGMATLTTSKEIRR